PRIPTPSAPRPRPRWLPSRPTLGEVGGFGLGAGTFLLDLALDDEIAERGLQNDVHTNLLGALLGPIGKAIALCANPRREAVIYDWMLHDEVRCPLHLGSPGLAPLPPPLTAAEREELSRWIEEYNRRHNPTPV